MSGMLRTTIASLAEPRTCLADEASGAHRAPVCGAINRVDEAPFDPWSHHRKVLAVAFLNKLMRVKHSDRSLDQYITSTSTEHERLCSKRLLVQRLDRILHGHAMGLPSRDRYLASCRTILSRAERE